MGVLDVPSLGPDLKGMQEAYSNGQALGAGTGAGATIGAGLGGLYGAGTDGFNGGIRGLAQGISIGGGTGFGSAAAPMIAGKLVSAIGGPNTHLSGGAKAVASILGALAGGYAGHLPFSTANQVRDMSREQRLKKLKANETKLAELLYKKAKE
jgi:MFS family permease